MITLSLVALLLACASVYFIISLKGDLGNFRLLSKENETVVSQAERIEKDLVELSKLDQMKKVKFTLAKSAIEVLADNCEANYTMTGMDKETLNGIAILRLRVDFTRASLGTLINFFNGVVAIGENVAISEVRMDALDGGMLKASYVVAILEDGTEDL
jgi:hypothetical protein